MSGTQESGSNVDVVRGMYAGLNRGDIPSTLAFFHPQILRIEWEGTPEFSVCRGLTEMEAHLIKGRSTWAEGGCDPKRFLVHGDRVIAFVHVRVRLKDKTEWIEGSVVDVFTLLNGKIIEFRSFTDKQKALDFVGIQD